MNLSIVTTLHQSESHVREFYARMTAAARKITDDYELIFVNDGSSDSSLEIALAIQRQDPCVIVIDLSRNFGHHPAALAGLSASKGEHVFLLDSDLEEEPELLKVFHEALTKEGCDVVFGVQANRKGRFFEQVSGRLFYSLFNLLSTTRITPNLINMRLMTRRYVQSLMAFQEHEVYLPGIWEIAGFRQIALTVVKHNRGQSSYTLRKKIRLFVNAITSFSERPLTIIFYSGILISAVSSIAIIRLIIRYFFFGIPIPGWTSLFVSIWFLGGIIIFFIGVIGIYLAKVYAEAKKRPRVLIRQIYPAKLEKDR